MFNRRFFPLLFLSAAAFLIVIWTTFNGIPTSFSRPEWHICSAPLDSKDTTVEGSHNFTKNSIGNVTETRNHTTPIWQTSLSTPYRFRPSPNAFVFYATTNEYACSVLVNINRLRKQFYTRYRIHVLLSKDVEARFITAIVEAGATLTIRDPPPLAPGGAYYYKDCLLKLMAFGLHQIDETIERVAVLDADQLILQNLDHVFDLPQTDLAAPRADWIARDAIASTFMVISLSDRLWETVKLGMETIGESRYDMDLINELFANKVLLLPSSYVALNSLWHAWITPDWYRPEEGERRQRIALTNEQKKLQGEEFWRALSIMNDSNPFSKEFLDEQPEEEREEEKKQAVPTGLGIKRRARSLRRRSDEDGMEDDLESSSTMSSSESPSSTQESSPSASTDEAPSATTVATEHEDNANPFQAGSFLDPAGPEEDEEEEPSDLDFLGTVLTDKPSDEDASLPTSPSAKPTPYHTPIDPLQALYKHNAKILHFTAGGKPWTYTMEQLSNKEPGAHPLYYEQYFTWRKEAKQVCPPIMKTKQIVPDGEGSSMTVEVFAGIVEEI